MPKGLLSAIENPSPKIADHKLFEAVSTHDKSALGAVEMVSVFSMANFFKIEMLMTKMTRSCEDHR